MIFFKPDTPIIFQPFASNQLVALCNCKKSEEEIAKALQSNGRKDYLFGLKQEYHLYINFQQKMKECDVEIEKLLKEQINNDDEKKLHYIDKKV